MDKEMMDKRLVKGAKLIPERVDGECVCLSCGHRINIVGQTLIFECFRVLNKHRYAHFHFEEPMLCFECWEHLKNVDVLGDIIPTN